MKRIAGLTRGTLLMHLAENGYVRTKASSSVGVCKRTFLRAMRRERIKAPNPVRKQSLDDVRLIRALLADGVSPAVVARKFEVDRMTVVKIERRITFRSVK